MDIYTIAKEEANIKRQKTALERKVLVDDMRRREAKMLEAFDDLGIKYCKSSWYRERTEQVNGSIEFKYDVFLTTEMEKKNSVEVKAAKSGYELRENWGDCYGNDYETLDELIESVVRYIRRANGC